MILDESSISDLTNWLIKHLEPMSGAEPDILANYVFALLKNDEPREKLEEELAVFLKDETKKFVSDLFGVLKEDPKSGKTIFKDSFTIANSNHPNSPSSDKEEDEDRDPKHSRRDQVEGKRRREERFGDEGERKRRKEEDRYYRRDKEKRHERYEEGGRFSREGRKGRRSYERKSRGRCRDYDEKGYCMQGELCPYDHGSGYVVTDVQGLEQIKGLSETTYDPDTPAFRTPWDHSNLQPGFNNGLVVGVSGNNSIPVLPLHGDSTFQKIETSSEDIIQVGGRGMYPKKDYKDRDKDRDRNKDRESRGKFDKSSLDPSIKNTVVVSEIPQDLNNIDNLNGYFKQFGTIVNIQVKPNLNKAFIQFAQNSEAYKALKSPEAVLGNRFIRTQWASKQNKQDSAPPEPKKPIEPFKNKLELNKANSEKSKADTQKLQKEKEELRTSQLEQTKSLLESLTKMKNMDPLEKAAIINRINALTNNVALSLAKDSSHLEKKGKNKLKSPKVLKAEKEKEGVDMETQDDSKKNQVESSDSKEIQKLEQEQFPESKTEELERLQKRIISLKNIATNMGIDLSSPLPQRGRGRGVRGRGRGLVSRGRGRGGIKRTMTLDNRTTTIIIHNLPEELRDNEALQNHFKTFGTIANISLEGEKVNLQFTTRRAAELAFKKGKSFKTFNLNMTWQEGSKTDTKSLESQEEEGMEEQTNEEIELYQPGGEEEEEYREYDEYEEEGEERSWKH